MQIIEFPLKEGQIVEFEKEYYKITMEPTSCSECDLYNKCAMLNISCSAGDFILKRVEKTNCKNIIKLPILNNDILKIDEKYFCAVTVASETKDCSECAFNFENCSTYVVCGRNLLYKQIDEYELLFLKGEKDV